MHLQLYKPASKFRDEHEVEKQEDVLKFFSSGVGLLILGKNFNVNHLFFYGQNGFLGCAGLNLRWYNGNHKKQHIRRILLFFSFLAPVCWNEMPWWEKVIWYPLKVLSTKTYLFIYLFKIFQFPKSISIFLFFYFLNLNLF